MFKLRGANYRTLHQLKKNNEYVVEVYEPKKEGEKYTILSDAMFKACFKMREESNIVVNYCRI